MKIWKRNAVVATVLLFVCAGIYLNWSFNKSQQVASLTDVIDADALMNEDYTQTLVDAASEDLQQADAAASADYFASIRLSRQQSRDSAIELLQETISYESGADDEAAGTASAALEDLVSTALTEAQIESMVVAKGYADCVVYMNDDQVSVAVAAPADGLQDPDVAVLADIVTSQTDYDMSAIHIIEVGAAAGAEQADASAAAPAEDGVQAD